MTEVLVQLFSSFSPEVATGLLAMLPLTELRAALPLGMTVFALDPMAAYVASVIGNAVPMVLILLFLPAVLAFAKKHSALLQRFFERFVYPLEQKHRARYQKYGRAFLFIFTAIPLPVSGVWTASVLAVLFGIDKRYAFQAIALGMLTAGLIILLIMTGVLSGLSFLL